MTYLRKADHYPTAYHGARITPEIFVWHDTAGGGKWWLDQLFSGQTTNNGAKITVHFAIYQDGDLVEYAPWRPGEAVACWHAGKSVWQGRESCNFFSLGCEIQRSPREAYTGAQLEAIDYLTRLVRTEYPDITHTTHKYISGALQGKTDPYSPQWEQQAWPVVQKAAGLDRKDGELSAEMEQLIKMGRVSDVARSYDVEIIRAEIRGDTERVAKLEADKLQDLEDVRKALGLD